MRLIASYGETTYLRDLLCGQASDNVHHLGNSVSSGGVVSSDHDNAQTGTTKSVNLQ